MNRKRTFHYITETNATSAESADAWVEYKYGFRFDSYEVESMDTFEDEVVLIAYPIAAMQHIDTLLRHFGLNDNSYYFFQQIKDLIAVPEKHIDDKGKGKIDFQVFFKNVPYSFMSINNRAIVLIGLHPVGPKNAEGLRDYNLIGYIHANNFNFRPDDGSGDVHPCYYYSLLRVADKVVNGEHIYRRKKLFTMFFSVLNRITVINDVYFAYASMGRENVAINDALHKCATDAGIHYERLHYKMFGQINLLWGSKSESEKLIDITGDRELLKTFYARYRALRSEALFFQPDTEEEFFEWMDKICGYSSSSRVYARMNGGEIKAATLALNWPDYFVFLILNPKGAFRLVEQFKLIQRILFPILTIGEPDEVRRLYKGLAYKYRREQQCQVTFLPSYEGDPYYSVKKGLLDDNLYYFVITKDEAGLQRYKQLSADEKGRVQPFVEMPMT